MNSFAYTNPYFGSHIPFSKTLQQTIEHALTQRMYSIQFFLGNRLSLKRTTLSSTDVEECNHIVNVWDIKCFTHIPYIINFAGKGGKLAHNSNIEAIDYVNSSICSVQQELNALQQIKCSKKGCVIHIGSIGEYPNRKDGLDCVIESINKLTIPSDTPLCLETMVGRGGVLGTSFDELKYIIDGTNHSTECVKLCIDTCHLFAEGYYHFGKHAEIDRCFKDIESVFGSKGVLQCVHFNDSRDEFNSKKDRHESIGKGTIFTQDGKEMSDSVRYFLERCERERVPVLLETTEDDYDRVCRSIF